MYMRNKWKWLFIAPAALTGILILMAAVAFIGGEIVMRLWNWLAPPIFGWRQVNFWQALGLLVLCRILFGGHVYRSNSHRRKSEDRERIRRAFRERCGFPPPNPDPGRGGDAAATGL
jgi:hypothetical protein